MPKPSNKKELISESRDRFLTLLTLVESYPLETQRLNFPHGSLNRNIRDVLTHLHEWHLMTLRWYKIGMEGSKPAMPAEGYTWRSLPDLNKKIWQEYQTVSLEDAKELFTSSSQKIQAIIDQHSNEELFTKKKYAWTGSTSLGAYLISCTFSHYSWAIKFIKKGLKGA